MSNEPRRVFVGLLPSGTVTFVGEGEVDPVARLIADAGARLAAERATAEKARRGSRTRRRILSRRFIWMESAALAQIYGLSSSNTTRARAETTTKADAGRR
jgi:hypothetical protein